MTRTRRTYVFASVQSNWIHTLSYISRLLTILTAEGRGSCPGVSTPGTRQHTRPLELASTPKMHNNVTGQRPWKSKSELRRKTLIHFCKIQVDCKKAAWTNHKKVTSDPSAGSGRTLEHPAAAERHL